MDARILGIACLLLLALVEALGIRQFLRIGLYTQAVWKGAAAGMFFGTAISMAIHLYL